MQSAHRQRTFQFLIRVFLLTRANWSFDCSESLIVSSDIALRLPEVARDGKCPVAVIIVLQAIADTNRG